MYIVFEGIDGSGKTTHTKMVRNHYKEKGMKTHLITEPTQYTAIGKIIRRELKQPSATDQVEQNMLSLLFAADRLSYTDAINYTKGREDNLLISDRSYYSSICYQDDPEWINLINKKMPKPDYTILLDLDAREAIHRCDGIDTFENKDLLEKARLDYLCIAELEDNFIVVDANRSKRKVHNEIINILSRILSINQLSS